MACTATATAGYHCFPSLQPLSYLDPTSEGSGEEVLASSAISLSSGQSLSSCSISPSPLASSSTPTPTAAADLPADILNCIRKSLPLDDFLRFPSVCTSWRSAAERIARQPFSDTEFPWLFSFPLPHYRNKFAAAISLSPDKSLPPKTYSIPIPQRFQGHTAISSNFHCLMIENTEYKSQDPDTSGIYLVNPFDSWTQLGRLPSSSTLSADPTRHPKSSRIIKIAMNSIVAVSTWKLYRRGLAYTRLGIDRRWIDLTGVTTAGFEDVVTYKDDMFCAADIAGAKVVALDFSSTTVKLIDMTLNLRAYEENDGWKCFQTARLVSSSSNLFLIRWRSLIKKGGMKRREVDVYKLIDDGGDDAKKEWVPVKSLGNFSFFVGSNQSISLSTTNFPKLRSNCIYIPHDATGTVNHNNCSAAMEDDNDFRYHLVYDLGDGSWDEYYSAKEHFRGLWMTPRLLSNGNS